MAVANVDAAQSCIEHDGMTRCWYTYIPESVKEAAGDDESVALVMDLHGYNLCAAESAQYSGWNRMVPRPRLDLSSSGHKET